MKRVPLGELKYLSDLNPLLNNSLKSNLLPSDPSLPDNKLISCQEKHIDIVKSFSPKQSSSHLTQEDVKTPPKYKDEENSSSPSIKKSITKSASSGDKANSKQRRSLKKQPSWFKMRNRRRVGPQIQKSTDTNINIKYAITPKKLLSQLIQEPQPDTKNSIEPEEEEGRTQEGEGSTEIKFLNKNSLNNADAQMMQVPIQRSVICLNSLNTGVKSISISGFNINFGGSMNSFTFPSTQKTVKFIV